jgi:hypothetical protein
MVLDHPSVKTYIAIALNKGAKGGVGQGFVEKRLAAYITAKMAEKPNEDLPVGGLF